MKNLLSRLWRLFYAIGFSKLDAWVLRGRELSTGEPLSIAYIGTDYLKNYYADLAFAEGYNEKHLGKCRPVLFRLWIGLFHRDCNLTVLEINEEKEIVSRFLGRTLRSPVWMRAEINITGSLESSMLKDRYKDITRQVKKAGLSYEIRTDDEAFEEFYHKQYLPTVGSRHGDRGMVISYDILKKCYKQGEIVMVKRGEELVGGGLVDLRHEKPRFMMLGVRDGSEEYVKMGVTSAIYYFICQRMLDLGGKVINLGSSRGFLKDRPLKFKMSLGATLASFHVEESGYLHLQVRKLTPALKAFLINNPFFTQDQEGKYWAAIFIDSVQSVPDDARELAQKFNQEFVSPLIYTFDSPEYLRANAAAIKTLPGDCPVESIYSAIK